MGPTARLLCRSADGFATFFLLFLRSRQSVMEKE
jgi:hypothetical protein